MADLRTLSEKRAGQVLEPHTRRQVAGIGQPGLKAPVEEYQAVAGVSPDGESGQGGAGMLPAWYRRQEGRLQERSNVGKPPRFLLGRREADLAQRVRCLLAELHEPRGRTRTAVLREPLEFGEIPIAGVHYG